MQWMIGRDQSRGSKLRRALLALLVMLPFGGNLRAESEGAVKAAYLINFAKFVEWPVSAFASGPSLVIGAVGRDAVGDELARAVADLSIGGCRIEFRKVSAVDSSALVGCHLLLVPESEREESILSTVRGRPVPVVGDGEDFARRGGALGFVKEAGAVRFEANPKAAAWNGLNVSAKLLRVARSVVNLMTSMFFSGIRFRDLSIRGKVMLVTCAASFAAIFAFAGGLYLFQLRHFRDSYQRELRALAHIMAENCAPALAFDDAKTVKEVLAPLTAKPEIENDAVLGGDGKLFANFGGDDDCPVPKPDDPAGIVDRGKSWTVVQPIVLDGGRIGTFFLDADYAGPRGALQRLYLGVTSAVLGGSLALVVLLTMRLQ
jgi:hypothetical protein